MKAAHVGRRIWISGHAAGERRGGSGFLFERIFVPLRLRSEFTIAAAGSRPVDQRGAFEPDAIAHDRLASRALRR